MGGSQDSLSGLKFITSAYRQYPSFQLLFIAFLVNVLRWKELLWQLWIKMSLIYIISSLYHMAKCNWLIYISSHVKKLPTFCRNVCYFPPLDTCSIACGLASVPMNSGLQRDVLAGDSWGTLPFCSSAVLSPSPSHRDVKTGCGNQPFCPAFSLTW